MNPDDPASPDNLAESGTYRIWIAGPLDPAAPDRTAGVDVATELTDEPECITVLQGKVADLAELDTVLRRLRALHFRVLGIVRCTAAA